MSVKRLAKTTKKQYEELLDFLEKNKIILTGRTKPLEAKKISKLWGEFAVKVNSTGYGPQKTAEQWRKVFNKWKINTRRKTREIHVALTETGGGPPIKKELTDLEQRLLSLISALHLGDHQLPEAGVSEDKCEIPSSAEGEITFVLEDFDAQAYAETETNSIEEKIEEMTPQITNEDEETTIQKEKMRTPRGNQRYTNTILKDACESYAAAQIEQRAATRLKANAINNLSCAVDKVAEHYKEAQTLRARAE